MLANGTILVVGGERGSNDIATPSLELLPRVRPVLPMEWLARTDSYNLYPFLAVLPSGRVFVAYYNEARILNPETFDTISTLPPVPAGVTSSLGGRTYPLSGYNDDIATTRSIHRCASGDNLRWINTLHRRCY
jgi:hypothetical protein